MPGEAAAAPELRHVSRVLIADPLDRVRLLHFRLRDGRDVWIPPGGGEELGETAEEAAVREVREETSIVLTDPMRLVWLHRIHYFQRDVLESYFFVRVAATPSVVLEPVPGGPADLLEYRWWTCAEIADAEPEIAFTPREIAGRLGPLLAGSLPVVPIEIAE